MSGQGAYGYSCETQVDFDSFVGRRWAQVRGHLPGLYTQRRGVRSQPCETDPPESLAIHEEGGGGSCPK